MCFALFWFFNWIDCFEFAFFSFLFCYYWHNRLNHTASTVILHAKQLYECICVVHSGLLLHAFCLFSRFTRLSSCSSICIIYCYWSGNNRQCFVISCSFLSSYSIWLFRCAIKGSNSSTISGAINSEPNECFAFLSFLEKPYCFDGNTFNSDASTKFNRLLYNCSVKWKIRARYIARWNRMYQCDRWKDKFTHTRTHTKRKDEQKATRAHIGMGEYGLWTSMNRSHSHKQYAICQSCIVEPFIGIMMKWTDDVRVCACVCIVGMKKNILSQ